MINKINNSENSYDKENFEKTKEKKFCTEIIINNKESISENILSSSHIKTNYKKEILNYTSFISKAAYKQKKYSKINKNFLNILDSRKELLKKLMEKYYSNCYF